MCIKKTFNKVFSWYTCPCPYAEYCNNLGFALHISLGVHIPLFLFYFWCLLSRMIQLMVEPKPDTLYTLCALEMKTRNHLFYCKMKNPNVVFYRLVFSNYSPTNAATIRSLSDLSVMSLSPILTDSINLIKSLRRAYIIL